MEKVEVPVFADSDAEEFCELVSDFLLEEGLGVSVDQLVLLVAEHGGAGGIEVDDVSVGGFLDADEEGGEAAVAPVLQDDPLIELVLFLGLLVDVVVD